MISPTGISAATPSRRTVGFASPMTTRLSSVFLACTSWIMPIAVLATITKPNSASWIGATASMMTKRMPMMALKRVKMLARMMSGEERTGTSLTSPRLTRSATSAVLSPGLPGRRAAASVSAEAAPPSGSGSSTAVSARYVMTRRYGGKTTATP